jgi:shikimate dehydrogenase
VGAAIAASLAAAGCARLGLHDTREGAAAALSARLAARYPQLDVTVGAPDPAGFDIAVNATPLGMKPGGPLPFDTARLSPRTLVGEVVLQPAETPLIAAARARGCETQIGTDMLFEQIPAYLDFFGLPSTTSDTLRRVARLTP